MKEYLVPIEELVQSEIFSRIFNWVYKESSSTINKLNESKKLITLDKINKEDYLDFFKSNFIENYKWASQISFKESISIKDTRKIFVTTDIFLTPSSQQINSKGDKISFKNLFNSFNNSFVLYGEPGAGKTTSVKKIFLDYFINRPKELESFGYILILRLNNINSLNEEIDELFYLKMILKSFNIIPNKEGKNPISKQQEFELLFYLVVDFLESVQILLIFDGFDEINNEHAKRTLVNVLKRFSSRLEKSKFILTCRCGAFDYYIENTKEFEIAPFTNDQIQYFIRNWFDKKSMSENFYNTLLKKTYLETARRPLNLSHLCAIYERELVIPDKPKTIYEKIIFLLLEKWDSERGIFRKSKYSNFKTDRKIDFLSRFSYEITVVCNTVVFDRNLISLVYETICDDFNLPKNESLEVIKEIISHNGLIKQESYGSYIFSHKSLQEYFVANYILKLPELTKNKSLLLRIPNELAIVIALSSTPELFLFKLVKENLKGNIFRDNFISELLKRMEIEKPDFRPNILLPITYLYILNKLLNILSPIVSKEKEPKPSDYSYSEEKLVRLNNLYIKIRNSIKELPKNYKKTIDKKYILSVENTKREIFLKNKVVNQKNYILTCQNTKLTINSIQIKLPKKIVIDFNLNETKILDPFYKLLNK